MKISKFKDIKWIYNSSLSVDIGFEDNLPCNSFADIVYAKLKAGNTLLTHFHNRPHKDGYEAFFFFRGAHIEILLADNQSEIIHSNDPFHITFQDQEIHGMKNINNTELIFEVICAPKYQKGEEILAK